MLSDKTVKTGAKLIITTPNDTRHASLLRGKVITVVGVNSWGCWGYVDFPHAAFHGFHVERGNPHQVATQIPWDEVRRPTEEEVQK